MTNINLRLTHRFLINNVLARSLIYLTLIWTIILSFAIAIPFASAQSASVEANNTSPTTTALNHNSVLAVHYSESIIEIDGQLSEAAWSKAQWQPLDQLILGEQPQASDFSGRYKLLWNEDKLYLAAEIIDDVLFDKTPEPTKLYWDDDCLEVFIDEDASGGEHQLNHNAFAYHVALDTQIADYTPDNVAKTFNDHIEVTWRRDNNQPHIIYWELAIDIYPDTFSLNAPKGSIPPVTLTENKLIGFMLAYCDNDGSTQRESFIGSHVITPINDDKNLGYKNADVFGKIKLIK